MRLYDLSQLFVLLYQHLRYQVLDGFSSITPSTYLLKQYNFNLPATQMQKFIVLLCSRFSVLWNSLVAFISPTYILNFWPSSLFFLISTQRTFLNIKEKLLDIYTASISYVLSTSHDLKLKFQWKKTIYLIEWCYTTVCLSVAIHFVRPNTTQWK